MSSFRFALQMLHATGVRDARLTRPCDMSAPFARHASASYV